jgi:hypothetical protein
MNRVYIILSAPHTRKSSCIRTLTGARKRDIWQVRFNAGNDVDIFVQIKALQEDRIDPQKFIDEMNERNIDYVLTALRIRNCQDYLNAFLSTWPDANFIVQILGQGQVPIIQNPRVRVLENTITNSATLPNNAIAQQVRQEFGWI